MRLSPLIAIYARVSSDQQVQQGTIDSQLAAVQAFASAQGVRIDPDLIFADNGVSGGTLARTAVKILAWRKPLHCQGKSVQSGC